MPARPRARASNALKHPGLAIVGVLGMAVAVTIGAITFGVIYTISDQVLPLGQGARIVEAIRADA